MQINNLTVDGVTRIENLQPSTTHLPLRYNDVLCLLPTRTLLQSSVSPSIRIDILTSRTFVSALPYPQMKLNVANPATGAQKSFDIQDERLVRCFYEKRMSQDVEVDSLGEEWKGYVLRIGGGNDKQGFPMKQGVLLPNRVRLLLSKGDSCYRPRRTGERKRKSVRGCIVGPDIQALHLIVVKQATRRSPVSPTPSRPSPSVSAQACQPHPQVLQPLQGDGLVRQFVVRREVVSKKEGAKPYTKAPKIQRLVTAQRLQRKRHSARSRSAGQRPRRSRRRSTTSSSPSASPRRKQEVAAQRRLPQVGQEGSA